jgi:hypothetical protein
VSVDAVAVVHAATGHVQISLGSTRTAHAEMTVQDRDSYGRVRTLRAGCHVLRNEGFRLYRQLKGRIGEVIIFTAVAVESILLRLMMES